MDDPPATPPNMPAVSAKTKSSEAPLDPYQHVLAALARVSDAVITINAAAEVVFMNAAAENITRCLLHHAAGKQLSTVLSIVDSVTGNPIDAAVEEIKQQLNESALRHAVVMGGADSPIIIEYSVSPLLSAAGAFAGAVIVFRDVMTQRASQLALQSSEQTRLANAAELFEAKERAHVTLNSIGDAVISTDFRGRITYLNVIAEKLTGWSQTDARGRPLEEVFSLVDSTSRQPVLSPAMQAIIENETVVLDAQKLLIRRDGAEIAVQDSTSPIHDERGGVVGAVLVAQDVTVAREEADRLVRLALYDPLTGLPNRTLLTDRLTQAMERAHRHQRLVALLFIDLDGFKLVNDTEGHAVGDQLLESVGDRLATCIRASDTVCRYGGDEFIVMLADILTADDAAICGAKILASIHAPFRLRAAEVNIGASIGIAIYPADAHDPESLIKRADSAMYAAKAAGRNLCHFYAAKTIAPA